MCFNPRSRGKSILEGDIEVERPAYRQSLLKTQDCCGSIASSCFSSVLVPITQAAAPVPHGSSFLRSVSSNRSFQQCQSHCTLHDFSTRSSRVEIILSCCHVAVGLGIVSGENQVDKTDDTSRCCVVIDSHRSVFLFATAVRRDGFWRVQENMT